MSIERAQYDHYMAEYYRHTALAYEAEAKARACAPGKSAEDREWDEARLLNLAHDYRKYAARQDAWADEELQERAA